MARKGTVESSLSAEALHEFCEKLAALPNLTLRRMQDEAKKLGITLSRSAAGRFAGGTFAEHLRRLQRAREFAEQVESFNASGMAGSSPTPPPQRFCRKSATSWQAARSTT